jgi:ribA/ribD-fused uncharacterized protein
VIDPPIDVDDLRRRVQAGWRPEFLFFWSHEQQIQGSIGGECFSQWYPAPFELEGVRYATAEHYMMSRKARLFGDDEAARQILASPHPADAKRLGRDVRGFSEAVWVEHRAQIVLEGNLAKFGQNGELRRVLLDSHPYVLAEASPTDRVWGIGLTSDDERAYDPARWRGLSLLGFALMAARSRLGGQQSWAATQEPE